VQNPPNRKGFTSIGIIFPFSSIGLLHEPGNFLNVTLYQFYLKNIQDQFYFSMIALMLNKPDHLYLFRGEEVM
jgi:hypothetical protein